MTSKVVQIGLCQEFNLGVDSLPPPTPLCTQLDVIKCFKHTIKIILLVSGMITNWPLIYEVMFPR